MIEVAVYCDVGQSMQSIKMITPVRIWANYCELRQDCILYTKGQLAKAKFLNILINYYFCSCTKIFGQSWHLVYKFARNVSVWNWTRDLECMRLMWWLLHCRDTYVSSVCYWKSSKLTSLHLNLSTKPLYLHPHDYWRILQKQSVPTWNWTRDLECVRLMW